MTKRTNFSSTVVLIGLGQSLADELHRVLREQGYVVLSEPLSRVMRATAAGVGVGKVRPAGSRRQPAARSLPQAERARTRSGRLLRSTVRIHSDQADSGISA